MNPTHFYVEGRRLPDRPSVLVVIPGNGLHNTHRRPLPLRLHWWSHSPDGFNWGYGGSGPAQLALALLGEVTPRALAVALHQAFKAEVVAGLPDDWTLTGSELRAWVVSNSRECECCQGEGTTAEDAPCYECQGAGRLPTAAAGKGAL